MSRSARRPKLRGGRCLCFNCTGRRVEGDKRQQEAAERERLGLAEVAGKTFTAREERELGCRCDECTHRREYLEHEPSHDPLRVPLAELLAPPPKS